MLCRQDFLTLEERERETERDVSYTYVKDKYVKCESKQAREREHTLSNFERAHTHERQRSARKEEGRRKMTSMFIRMLYIYFYSL